jgi:hypothetical protein
MRSLPSFLPNTMMGFSRKHVLVGMPKITEGVAVLVVIWNALPQTAAGGFASLANGEPHDVARSAAHRRPHPSLVIFFAHTTPDFIPFENVICCRRQKGFFDIRQVLDVRFEPARNGLPRHGKDACHSTQATTLQASPQHGVLLGFRIRLLWLENAIRATVLAMVLSIPTTMGSIFDDVCPFTDTADVRHCFLNHDANSNSSLTT